tara:strand:+ start:242 stop:445 length:204 start_codon:yes stop_codon:yes gene_type:complete
MRIPINTIHIASSVIPLASPPANEKTLLMPPVGAVVGLKLGLSVSLRVGAEEGEIEGCPEPEGRLLG